MSCKVPNRLIHIVLSNLFFFQLSSSTYSGFSVSVSRSFQILQSIRAPTNSYLDTFVTYNTHSYTVLPSCVHPFLNVYTIHFILNHTFCTDFVYEFIVMFDITYHIHQWLLVQAKHVAVDILHNICYADRLFVAFID